MAVSETPRLGLTQWSVGTDPLSRLQLNDDNAGLEAKVAGALSGTAAARPAAAAANARFIHHATDTGVFSWSTGAAWVPLENATPGALQSAQVDTYEQTSSMLFTDLATIGPSVSVTHGAGARLVIDFASLLRKSGTVMNGAEVAPALSGANVLAPNAENAIGYFNDTTGTEIRAGRRVVVTLANAGTTTITLKYHSSDSNTMTFASRLLTAEIR